MSVWDIKSFVYDCTAKNNEEYRQELKKRMRTMIVLFVLGALTLATMIVLIILKPEMLESYEYITMRDRCMNYVPQSSLVGMLMEHDENA